MGLLEEVELAAEGGGEAGEHGDGEGCEDGEFFGHGPVLDGGKWLFLVFGGEGCTNGSWLLSDGWGIKMMSFVSVLILAFSGLEI